MINQAELAALIAILKRRNCSVFHACQLKDFRSYARLGGVPSRKKLSDEGLEFTPFDTDQRDQENRVWDKVFFNLSDFGKSFCKGVNSNGKPSASLPNPFGPILLKCSPEILSTAVDVAICLRSAGAKDFDREKESIGIGDVERLFLDHADTSTTNSINFDLRAAFPGRDVGKSPEISCSFADGVALFVNPTQVIVDPYVINGRSLTTVADKILSKTKVCSRRFCDESRDQLYSELGSCIAMPNGWSLESVDSLDNKSQNLTDWIAILIQKGMQFDYKRFAKYLKNGTLSQID